VLLLVTNILTTPSDQSFVTETSGEVVMKKNRFMTWFRKVFKGEKVILRANDKVNVKFMQDIKTDLTNGWIYYQN
jgi:hypothetical protein